MDSTLENSCPVVVARGDSKPKKSPSTVQEREEKVQPWKPEDLVVDPERQARLMEKMQDSMLETKRSSFYTTFFHQLKSPEISEQFRFLLGTETKLQMVIYGLGSIENKFNPRVQLNIALLMKREFNWIGEIQVFDPVLSATECSVIASLGCTVLSVNEHARREALKPTIFFMPFCYTSMYDNLLETNWRNDRLSNIALLGNSFQNYSNYTHCVLRSKQILEAGRTRVTREFAIKAPESDHFSAFNGLSWHFFSPGVHTKLQLSNFVDEYMSLAHCGQ